MSGVFFYIGSRDNRLAFWSIPDECTFENDENNNNDNSNSNSNGTFPIIQPLHHHQGASSQDKVRAMVYNDKSEVRMSFLYTLTQSTL